MKSILNEKIKYVKELYEERIQDHIKFQTDLMIQLARYKALTPDSYGFLNYTLAETFENWRIVETDPQVIWDTLKKVYGKTFFFAQLQDEYASTFTEKDKERLDHEIYQIKVEARSNIENITEKCKYFVEALPFWLVIKWYHNFNTFISRWVRNQTD